MVAEGGIFRGDGCDGSGTLGTDEVYETTLGAGAGWGTTTVDFVVNSGGNVGGGEGGVSGVSTDGVEGMARLRSVVICLIGFCILSPNKKEGTVGLGSIRIVMMYPID